MEVSVLWIVGVCVCIVGVCVYCGSVCVCVLCECEYQVVLCVNTDHGVCNNVSQVLTATAEEGINSEMLPGGIPHIPHCQPLNTVKSQHTVNTTHPNALRMSSWSRETCFSCSTVLTSSECVCVCVCVGGGGGGGGGRVVWGGEWCGGRAVWGESGVRWGGRAVCGVGEGEHTCVCVCVYMRQNGRGMLATLITLLIQCCFQWISEHQRA